MKRFARHVSMAVALLVVGAGLPIPETLAGPPTVLPPNVGYAPMHQPAGPPRYLLLETDHSAVGQPVRAGSYAYGWFGVAPRSHYATHRGYYGDAYLWRGRITP